MRSRSLSAWRAAHPAHRSRRVQGVGEAHAQPLTQRLARCPAHRSHRLLVLARSLPS